MYKLVQNVLNLGLYGKCVRLVQLKRAKFVSYATTYWQSYRSGNKPTLLQILYSMHLFTCCKICKYLSAVCIFNEKVLFSLNCIHKRNFWSPKIMKTSICHLVGLLFSLYILHRLGTETILIPFTKPYQPQICCSLPQISNKPSTE